MCLWYEESESGGWPLWQVILSKISSVTLQYVLSNKAKKTLSMDGPVVSLQYTALPIMKRSQLSCGTFYHAYQTSVAHFDHWSPLQLPETVFNVLLGTVPKARVTLVHPAQANTKLCGNPYADPSKILCCFPANQAIFTQNKQQFDKQFEFWALLFVT